MKNLSAILLAILLIITGCKGKKQTTDDLIVVDVNANYPKKELILQDFMDVEYIPLETNEEFLTQGLLFSVGKNIMILRNYADDGNIFVYDRMTGKALKKINRKGQGGEEYTVAQRIVLDEDNREIFVNDHYASIIFVYDLDGNFKRKLKQEKAFNFAHVHDFDRENLICNNYWETDRPPYTIISKEDGRTTQAVNIPFEEKLSILLTIQDEVRQVVYVAGPRSYNPIILSLGNWILTEFSSDTIYKYSADHTMKPLIVRTPPIRSMNQEVFLFPTMFTDRYYFMEAVKEEYDFESNIGFPAIDLVYDKQEKSIYKYTAYNDDYTDKTVANLKSSAISDEIAAWQRIEAYQLVEAYEKGLLKGRLKDIAAGLNEESNPVIMLMKHKK